MTSDSKTRRSVVIVACLCCVVLAGRTVRAAEGDEQAARADESREYFEKHVRPLLATYCYECHSGTAETLRAGLRVDGRERLLQGGDSGPAVVPGEPDESLLISAVGYETFQMPPRGKLSDDEIATLQRWIAEGAWWPPEEVATPGGEDRAPALDWRARQAAHWAWQPVSQPQPPTLRTAADVAPIDAFILDRLRAAGLEPSPEAQPHHLIRRLYLDLIGFPPTPQQLHEFTNAPTDHNYRRLVDRLLDSPQFGEKWARHWLDLVRYAETCGHEFDYPLPHAHRYRDYVIRAFNADIPYDQFVREHIAGDLLTEPRRHPVTGVNESIIGTGFWFLGEAVHAPTDVRADEADRIDNQLDVFGKTFLAMTIACARCHDHKFDPIPTGDYYALAGFLQSSRRQLAMLDPFETIACTTQAIAERRADGQRQLQAAVARATTSLADRFAELLLAARTRGPTSRAVDDSARALAAVERTGGGDRSAATNVIDRMMAALGDEALASPEHPLHVWHVLSHLQTADEFEAHRAALAARLQAQDDAQRQALAQMVRFADFRESGFDDWFVTGWAFGQGPTLDGQWDGPATAPQFAPPFMAHSGRFGAKQFGVLRSPTFTLEHTRIHYRLRAENVQLRLIVDGYVMDTYNALLFKDITLERVDTRGRVRWVSQHEDLNHYLGHRAHLEIIDHGNGFAALEGIYFSNAEPPPDMVHPWNLMLAVHPGLHSLSDLAAAYGDLFKQAAANGPSLSGEWTELWNWLLRWELIDLPDDWTTLAGDLERLQQALPEPELALAMADGTGEDERLHVRGNPRNLGPEVARRPPMIFSSDEDFGVPAGSGRRELAERLTAPDNPLLARVVVNRLWHHLMGRGLVSSVDDFGVMGQPPTHPLLLDWLARDLMQHRWSLKHAIRQIVLSRTYRQATRSEDSAADDADPENQLWHRAQLRRLTAEQLRDAMLDISGRFDTQMYGRSVPVHLTNFMTGRGRPRSGPLDGDGRRSIYIRMQRNFLSPMMLAFDMPAPFSTMGRRSNSNVPAQSLILMNDPFVWQQARRWAERLRRSTDDPRHRIELAYLQALGRPPQPDECAMVLEFIASQTALRQQPVDSLDVWTDLCHALWNTKEFLYIF